MENMPDAKRVLVVEDDEPLGTLISSTLREAGYHVGEATDGNKAIKALEATRYDVVVTDIIMPNREGVETIIVIRARWPDTKIVAMSGGGRMDASMFLSLAQNFGADALLKKPFRLQELLDVLADLSPS